MATAQVDPAVPRGPYPDSIARFPIVRQSLLSDADNCMLTSAFSVAYERGWSSEDAARGQIVHRTIAKALELLLEKAARGEYEERIPVDVVVDDLLVQVIRQADVEMQSVDGLGEDVTGIPLRQIAQARISLKAWAANQRFTVREIAGVEKRLATVLVYPDPETGEAIYRTFTGKLDLLLMHGDEAVVVDWKDTFGIPPESSISEEGYFQQRAYAKLVFDTYPRIQRVTLREFYVRYSSGKVQDRKGRPINPVREATVDRYVLPEIDGELNALVERFDRAHQVGVFKPTPGSHCSYCVRPTACPIFPKARRKGRIASRAEAEQAAGELVVARAAADQAADALRKWSNLHGDVDVKDAKRPRKFGPVVRQERRAPSLEEVRAATQEGRPLDELYVTKDVVKFAVHSPEEEHPFAKAAREEEEMLLAAEKAMAGRKRKAQR